MSYVVVLILALTNAWHAHAQETVSVPYPEDFYIQFEDVTLQLKIHKLVTFEITRPQCNEYENAHDELLKGSISLEKLAAVPLSIPVKMAYVEIFQNVEVNYIANVEQHLREAYKNTTLQIIYNRLILALDTIHQTYCGDFLENLEEHQAQNLLDEY